MNKPNIYLVGDAILDNYYWLQEKEKDLSKELSNLGYSTHNFAVDDLRVMDMFCGLKPRDEYKNTRHYKYLTESDHKLYPLKLLKDSTGVNKGFAPVQGRIASFSNKPKTENFVVVSMGGIDISDKLVSISVHAVLGLRNLISSVLNPDFIKNYENVLKTVATTTDKTVLVSMYLPYLGPKSKYGKYASYSKPILAEWQKFIFQIGKKHNIPILDLSRTLDYNDRSFYSQNDETRVSNKGNKCIAECISFICKNYDGFAIYYAPNGDINNIQVDST